VTWLAWRLQRTETLVAAAVLALIAALIVPTGIEMANAYHHDGLGACLSPNPGFACAQKIGSFQSRYASLTVLVDWLTLIPGVIGVLLAAPFIADLEHGTYRLAWTQSVTRRRWLALKLGLPVAAAVIAGAALVLLLTWWRTPLTHINGRLDLGTYDTTGVVAIGYTLFALGLGVALGALWRRSGVALTVAFVGYFVIRILDDYWLRNRLVSPLQATWRSAHPPRFLDNANIISQSVTVDGRVVESSSSSGVLGSHSGMAAAAPANAVFHAVYQPASYFWTMQLRETALFAVAAAVLIATAAWWTHRRTA
jgi:hypothetical protein